MKDQGYFSKIFFADPSCGRLSIFFTSENFPRKGGLWQSSFLRSLLFVRSGKLQGFFLHLLISIGLQLKIIFIVKGAYSAAYMVLNVVCDDSIFAATAAFL